MSIQPSPDSRIVVDSVNDARHPFGLPPGSIRGFFSLLICGFFWMIMLWPSQEGVPPIKAVLGHFFLLGACVYGVRLAPDGAGDKRPLLPWVLRFLFIGGSVAITAYAWFKIRTSANAVDAGRGGIRGAGGCRISSRWRSVSDLGWCCGLILLGRNNQIFMTVRSWLSVVGMILAHASSTCLFLGYASAEVKPVDFFRYWQVAELVVVSAYFGTRA